MKDLLRSEGLIDVVAGGDEDGGTEDEEECGKGRRVEDAEEGDVRVVVGEMHCNDMTIDVLGMTEGKDTLVKYLILGAV